MAKNDLKTLLAGDDESRKRWFSTGFMAGGGVASVDPEKHVLQSAVLIRPGEARGHGVWIDQAFCMDIATRGEQAASKGLKARFGHPNMCGEALGTFLGRWKGVKMSEDGRVVGDLHLSSTAAESPKGDLRNYVEQLAAKEPQHFGTSIVFSMDWTNMEEFMSAHQEEYDEVNSDGTPTGRKGKRFKSPDPDNVENLPHARCAELHAADLVDDPAATDGIFSGAGGASLAAQVTEWLDLHPEVVTLLGEDSGMVDILARYADQLKPFLAKYTAKFSQPAGTAESATAPEPTQPAAESAELQTRITTLEGQLSAAKAESETLSSQLAAASTRADTAEASLKTLTVEREQLAGQVQTLTAEKTTLQAECDRAKAERQDLDQKLTALSAGQAPLSSVPAPTEEKKGNFMEDARKSKSK